MATPGATLPKDSSALRAYFENSLYLLLLASTLSLISTGKLDLVSMLAAPAALLFKGYRWWRGHRPELSDRAASWLVGLYFLFFPVDLLWISRAVAGDAQNPGLFAALLAAIHLMLFATVVRLFSARTTRDCLFLALLALCAMLASAILTVDSAFIGFFLVFLGLAVSTFVGLEMRRASEGALAPALESGTPAARRVHTALGVTSAAVALGALLAGALIFVILPRFRAGYLSGFSLRPGLISGFSDESELGQIGEIQQSNSVVMRIRVQGDPSLAQNMHWRGVAFTNFDGRRWYTEERGAQAVSEDSGDWIELQPATARPRARSTPMQYTVLLEPMGADAVFVAAEPVRIRGQFAAGNGIGGRNGLRRTYLLQDKTGSLANPFHNFANISYEAVSELPRDLDSDLRRSPEIYPPSVRQMYLQLPRLDPRIPALARSITEHEVTPLDKARAIERYLPSHYSYTLDLSGAAAGDPLASFLFVKRAGHCEYFASAMTVMLRSLGIPARYVSGFLGGDYNDLGGDYIIRARHAHSWVEAYFTGYGWVTFDPTPPSAQKAPGFMARLGFFWDWFQLQWGEWVVNYDFIHQDALALAVRNAGTAWGASLQKQWDSLRHSGAGWMRKAQARIAAIPLWFPLAAAGLIALALAARSPALRERIALAWKLRRHRSGAISPDAAALSYCRMLRLLEKRGWRKFPQQTPLEFAAALPNRNISEPALQLTHLYQAARFGRQRIDSEQAASLLADLQRALREPA